MAARGDGSRKRGIRRTVSETRGFSDESFFAAA